MRGHSYAKFTTEQMACIDASQGQSNEAIVSCLLEQMSPPQQRKHLTLLKKNIMKRLKRHLSKDTREINKRGRKPMLSEESENLILQIVLRRSAGGQKAHLEETIREIRSTLGVEVSGSFLVGRFCQRHHLGTKKVFTRGSNSQENTSVGSEEGSRGGSGEQSGVQESWGEQFLLQDRLYSNYDQKVLFSPGPVSWTLF